ncbi:MAG: carboxypeptidase [Pseudolabrys sp.]|nr:carboxypeptidase [Pseudolabrys sp.]
MRRALSVVLLLGALSAAAQTTTPEKPAARHDTGGGPLRLLPADSVTQHSIDTAQGRLAYTATAGTFSLFDRSGEVSAAVFYTAYVLNSASGNRPITFAFNGGPGAASAFLHLGLVGPRVLEIGRDPARATLVDNPDTWLRFTDLVLIDPVGTGWSRAVKADEAKHFWNVRSDAEAMAKAIALYVVKNGRAGSPKYLLGESYGGLRAAKTARMLQREQGIAVSGIIMLSPLIEGWLTFGDDASALRSALKLPSLAAATLERRGAFDLAALAQVEGFAMTDYLTTLAGHPLQGDPARAFYERVAEMSGLPFDVVRQQRGFVTDSVVKTLRSADKKIVSRYDATFAVDDPFPEQRADHAPDPILDGVARAYGGAFAAYARSELGFNTEMTYRLLAHDVTQGWEWKDGRSAVGAEGDIRVMMSVSPSFRVLIAHGYSDLVTPYGMTRYILDHMPVFDPPGRITLKLYRGGHMFYLDPRSRRAFSADALPFYRSE